MCKTLIEPAIFVAEATVKLTFKPVRKICFEFKNQGF